MDKIEFIAKIRHLGWISYQLGANQEYNIEINDDQLTSLKNGVEFALEHPNMTAEQSHINWIRQKRKQGWNYGPVKDFTKKTHPDLVPFHTLPPVEARKDILSQIVHAEALKLWKSLNDDK